MYHTFINSKCSRTAIMNVIDEIQQIVDTSLDAFMDDENIQGIISDINEIDQIIEQIFVFTRSVATLHGGKKGISDINWVDEYNKVYSESLIPYEYKNQLNFILCSESKAAIKGYTNDSVRLYYTLERQMSNLSIAVDTLALLDFSGNDELSKYHDIQRSLFNKLESAVFEVLRDVLSQIMYHALHSKDDVIRERFITFSEI